MVSIRQSAPTTSIAAWRTISALPLPSKESRAPELANPRVRVRSSTATTWAFWVRWIQVTRRRSLVASTMSGHRRRTSTSDRPPPGAVDSAAPEVAVGAWSRAGPPVAGACCPVASAGGFGSGSGVVGQPWAGAGVGAGVGTGSGAAAAGAGRSWAGTSAGAWWVAAGAAAAGAGRAGAGRCAGWAAAGAGVPVTDIRRSRRSRRAARPSVPWSAAGRRTRAQISSSSRRGAVAPRISVSPAATRSAARVRSAAPNRAAWATSRSPASSETSMSPVAGASGTAATMTRSRRRRRRSSVNRRGSWPVSMTLSTTPKTDAPSPAAKASTTSSSRLSGV